jgi:hypothetical protein
MSSQGIQNLLKLKEMQQLEPAYEKLEGAWIIADVDGALEIQRLDELDSSSGKKHVDRQAFDKCFFSDWEAVGYVFLRALAGDETCRDAIEKCYGTLVPNANKVAESAEGDLIVGTPDSDSFHFRKSEISEKIFLGKVLTFEEYVEVANLLASNLECAVDGPEGFVEIDKRNFNDSFHDMIEDLREDYIGEK